VTGVRRLATGYRQFDVALKDIANHDNSGAKTQALKAEKTVLSAAKTCSRPTSS
jgi:hypothetical protein